MIVCRYVYFCLLCSCQQGVKQSGTYFHPNQHSGQLFPTGRKLKLLTDAANNITSIRHYTLLILFKYYTTLLLLLSSALNSLTFPLTHCSCCRIYLHSVAGWGLLKMVGVAMAMVAMPDFTSMIPPPPRVLLCRASQSDLRGTKFWYNSYFILTIEFQNVLNLKGVPKKI